ncbi:MAG: tRNA 2-thiocytidine biosynthesis TtcA family protein [Spirochaetaceae bacterium]|nr:tRNA 2-thiocytidine biosynthesis TtcA family protein [Spirochaetaceae bacterium]
MIDQIIASDTDKIPKWLMRTVKQVGKGINRFKMIQEGDEVLLAVSGGKDSLVLALALSIRLKWLPVKYKLKALNVNWREYPLPEPLLAQISAFFDKLEIPFESHTADMQPSSFKNRFNCYLCARNRKRILFEYAAKHNINKIATGHHMDDIAETTLINLCLRGNFSTMMPVQEFFNGKLKLIRPLCLTREPQIKLAAERLELPVYSTICPYKDTNLRLKMKPILKQLYTLDKHIYQHIFDAPWKINSDYLPGKL